MRAKRDSRKPSRLGHGNQGRTAVCSEMLMKRRKSATSRHICSTDYVAFLLCLTQSICWCQCVFRVPSPDGLPLSFLLPFLKIIISLLSRRACVYFAVCAYYYPLSSFLPLASRAPLTNVTHYSCSLLSFIKISFSPFLHLASGSDKHTSTTTPPHLHAPTRSMICGGAAAAQCARHPLSPLPSSSPQHSSKTLCDAPRLSTRAKDKDQRLFPRSLSLLPISISTYIYTHIFTLILALNRFLGLISFSFCIIYHTDRDCQTPRRPFVIRFGWLEWMEGET